MLHFSFRDRIAFNYLVSTALMMLFVFIVIYGIVSYTVYSHVDDDLRIEVNDHLSEIEVSNDNVRLVNEEEWLEQEHNTLNVNPVFVQILDGKRQVIEKSPNLNDKFLTFDPAEPEFTFFDTKLSEKSVRQVQFPVYNKKRIAGYIMIAMSLGEVDLVLRNLSHVLWISYPLLLVLLFFAARIIAGRNIRPIKDITATASAITRDSLKARIPLPQHRDELFTLSETINGLLDRIEMAIDREKRFTSDASHELRTPLAVVKGTLEVLIRKPRNSSEYQEKITYCINEVDRLNTLVDQLLLLARFENQGFVVNKKDVELDEIILDSLERFSSEIKAAELTIDFTFDRHYTIHSDADLASIVIQNLLSNAIKYSHRSGLIRIELSELEGITHCAISDRGIGIPQRDLDKIFGQFYRSEPASHPGIKGTGLGLSIIRRICDLLVIEIALKSTFGQGTTVTLYFT